VSAAALALLSVISVFIIGESYMTSVTPTPDQSSAILNTLLLCDVLVLCISILATVILWYLSSARYGSRKGRTMLSSGALYVYISLMILPVIFIACDLSFEPSFFAQMDVEIALALSIVSVVVLIPFSFGMLDYIRPQGMIDGLIDGLEKEFNSAGISGPVRNVALQRPVLRSGSGAGLASVIGNLCESGDNEPVLRALEQMRDISLEVKEPFQDIKSIAKAAAMVSMMAETASMAVKWGRFEIINYAVDMLRQVSEFSGHPGISSLAFRSMGAVFDLCPACMDERSLTRMETKLMEAYSLLYDRTGKHEALDMAAIMAEKAAGSKMFVTEEYDCILYTSGGVYRRLAEADGSEEYATKALTLLYEALTARTAEASPLDHACINGEIGNAYMAMAKIKNPTKSYRSAAGAFEDVGKMLNPAISPWDSALYRGKAACSYTMLAEEYCRAKRYDEALQAARNALPLYGDVIKFFERRSPELYVETTSDLGLANTIIGEVYLKSRMFDLSLKHASLALDAYSSASKAIDSASMPERFAAMKNNIGLTHVTMAEIHFREKRYENAISSCDSAIAAYNEALRIYDQKGKEKPAALTRKHLKKANDLFSTMMRIGITDRKPLEIEQ
jgi:tetratricopeptide (TPR) repeat protein